MISLASTRSLSLSYSAPSGRLFGNSASGRRPPSGGWRAENSEMMPRAPSINCRSVTSSRSFWTDSRASSVLPSITTSTSNSLDGKRRVTSSYCLNSGVLERNSWLSESSTLMRSMPKKAPIASAMRISAETDR